VGTPDLVFASRRKVIFVHGCFWHRHSCPDGRKLPHSKTDYWVPKLAGNRDRDRRIQRRLKNEGWDVLIIWECETKNVEALRQMLATFLN
jgi:DNA mismatch endonuclease (patch repair protein)